MKIENLKEGMILKNYKELCGVLCIQQKKSGSRQYVIQFKELDRHCIYHKEGHKIIIDKIFKEVKSKVDNRSKGNNTKYADDIEYLILTLLNKFKISKHEKVGFSKNFLYSHCGLSNDNYKLVKSNTLKFSQMIDMPVQTINECFDYTNNRMLKTLQSTLNKMKKQSLITWGNGYNMVMFDENNEQYLKVASIEDEKYILSVEREIMLKMGAANKRLIFTGGQWDSFKSKTNAELKKIYPDLHYYYDNISFNYNNEDIKRMLEKYENMKKAEVKVIVNDKFSKSLDGTIKRRHEKAKNSESDSILDNYKKSEDYPKEQKKIKDVIIKNDSKRIRLEKDYDEVKVKSLQKSFFERYSNETCEQLVFNDYDIADIPF
ncbi:hypothetical protein [Terrisporobacter sp.]|uniref:hypothetical protein n=1 Tax=Terrisporobacter sp. TaxID=1965305 RepID=UPI0026136C4B|nr:hypothetical protein [Terrisporobacter sp.]